MLPIDKLAAVPVFTLGPIPFLLRAFGFLFFAELFFPLFEFFLLLLPTFSMAGGFCTVGFLVESNIITGIMFGFLVGFGFFGFGFVVAFVGFGFVGFSFSFVGHLVGFLVGFSLG